MTPLPLDQIRLSWRSHKSALWWLGLMYRKPTRFRVVLTTLGGWRRVGASLLRLYLHALPYLLILVSLGRWLLFGLLDLGVAPAGIDPGASLVGHLAAVLIGAMGMGLAIGLAIAIGFGLIAELSERVARRAEPELNDAATGFEKSATRALKEMASGKMGGAFAGVAAGMSLALTFGIALGASLGVDERSGLALLLVVLGGSFLSIGLTMSLLYVPAGPVEPLVVLALVLGLVVGGSSARTYGSGFGLLLGSSMAAAFLLTSSRAFYWPLHLALIWPRARAQSYRLHPVAWDDCCSIPLPGLHRLLVAYADGDRAAGLAEIDRLIDDYPSQRGQALKAKTILVAREAARERDLARLDEIVAALPEGRRGYLAETRRLREKVHAITSQATQLAAVERLYLREPRAALLVKEIELFEQQIAGFQPPLAGELRIAARAWLEIARAQHATAQASVAREPVRQVFRAGDPVDRDQEAFVPRDGVFAELERQALLATGCPGLLLYGRRRTGKSTVLKNVASFLPPRVAVASLSMLKAEAFTSPRNWFGLLAQTVSETLPGLAPAGDPPGDLVGLERYLGTLDKRLAAEGRRLLIALDEYENLDRKIGEGVFSEDLLAVLRESIQGHRRLIWAFAGSHAIEELTHAAWTSYLVSVRTVEISLFTFAENQLLLTEPLKHSSLWKKDDSARPRFEPGFWGEGGIERIHREAHGWPHLVQLLAERVVDRVNDTGVPRVHPELLGEAFDIAVERGYNTLHELMVKESTLTGEWEYLEGFRHRDLQPPPEDAAVVRSLRRRLLVAEEGSEWRLAVPLMQRWLRLRG